MPSHACAAWALIKRILRYIRGTIGHGIHIYGSIGAQITVYSDADWAGCLDTRCSTSGYCVFIGDSCGMILQAADDGLTVQHRSQYRTIANATCYIRGPSTAPSGSSEMNFEAGELLRHTAGTSVAGCGSFS
jgi:hypothetical protein